MLPLLFCLQGTAQIKEGVIARPAKDGLMIDHEILPGETVFSIAKLYHVPLAALADANGFNYKEGFGDRTHVEVPVGSFNHLKVKPEHPADSRPLLYQAGVDEDLFRIGWRTGVPPKKLQEWNKLRDGRVKQGAYLHVGWILYDATQARTPPQETPSNMAQVHIGSAGQAAPEGIKEGSAQDLYEKQIQDGRNLITEKGAAAFFHMPVKTDADFFYGFHHAAPKGTIIRVSNPGSGQVVYVKVLGPLPNSKQYHNALIGISDRARKRLGVRDERAWCELSYTGY